MVTNICNFLEYFLVPENGLKKTEKEDIIKKRVALAFIFSYIWSIGGSFKSDAHPMLDVMIKDCFPKYQIPPLDTVFDYYIDMKQMKFTHWSKLVPSFDFNPADSYFSILVPTVDTTRY